MDAGVNRASGMVDYRGVRVTFRSLYLLQITKYCAAMSCTLALLEMLQTLPDEVAFIWPSPLTPVKVIFLANKYLVLVDTALSIVSAVPTEDTRLCSITYHALAYFYIVGIVLSEIILIIRTLALWGFNKYVKLLLFGGLAVMAPFAFYTVHQCVHYIDYPSRDELRVMGCVPATQDQDTWPAYASLILAETAILLLTILKRFINGPIFEGCSEGILVRTLYRDGTFFYAIVLAISVTNMLVLWLAPSELAPATQLPLHVVHSSLCTRVLLNIRKAAAETTGGVTDELTRQATMLFALGPPGERGGELRTDSVSFESEVDA
ncbi:hypothetical protein C8Q76DRAFT_235269 [Earliella scabrosa]|nr:hypothetical protein C8Q76DRAFT_235269 [Earliella scabrosa]